MKDCDLRFIPNSKELSILLDEINHAEIENNRPPLAALIVNGATGMPGKGFYECSENRPGCVIPDGVEGWVRALNAAWNYWSTK